MLELTDWLAISSLMICGAYFSYVLWVFFEVTR